MSTADNSAVRKSARHSKKIRNLEEEVESIFSQDENENESEIIHKTPSRSSRIQVVATPRASQIAPNEMLQTPRRSCRKSIKPTQDYEDIVNKSLRSSKKNLLTGEKYDEEIQKTQAASPKWTPAKVGRVSQKRNRKSRRTGKAKKQNSKEIDELVEETNIENESEQIKLDEVLKNETRVENIVEKSDKVHGAQNDILQEAKLDVSQTGQTKTHVGDDIVNNMERLKVKTEYNSFEANEKNYTEVDIGVDDALKGHNESIHLKQDDSDDCQFLETSEQDEICIVYENNISNKEKEAKEYEIHRNSPEVKAQEVTEGGGSFGTYLKSKGDMLSDLGLGPLKDEEEENLDAESHIKSSSQETEEMSPLIVFDDENETESVKESKKLNETFEADENSEEIVKSCIKSNGDMEILQLSEDECESSRKQPNVVLTDTELQNHLILSTLKGSFIKRKLPSTPKILLTPKNDNIRKQSSKAYRFPTPYRNKQSFKFNDELKENIVKKTPNKNLSSASMIINSTPRDIVLRGIRKRSLSVCINGNEQNRQKFSTDSHAKKNLDRTVSFYSPANQTTVIDDLDIKIAKSLKESKPREEVSVNQFVTKRRKRSMSFDDSMMCNSLSLKLPRPIVKQNTASKTQPSSTFKPQPRTKLPNFTAIHQKQFQQMENLVDHVNRKQERSKILINSNTKLKTVSAQSSISLIKNSYNILAEKPKALKKINLEHVSQIKSHSSAMGAASRKILEESGTKKANHLSALKLGETKTMKSGLPRPQQINKYLKTSQIANIEHPQLNTKPLTISKATFSMSTSQISKSTTTSSSFAQSANTSYMNNDKVATRLQKHMDLFKGRVASTRTGATARKNESILKGVRSNRRFELQMQHRKNLEY